jgi:hypothetical protein
VGDRFERILIKIMKASHEFLYVCDTGERKNICRGGQMMVVKAGKHGKWIL